jgi:hypothetical protein
MYRKELTKQRLKTCVSLFVTLRFPFSSFTVNSPLCTLTREAVWVNQASSLPDVRGHSPPHRPRTALQPGVDFPLLPSFLCCWNVLTACEAAKGQTQGEGEGPDNPLAYTACLPVVHRLRWLSFHWDRLSIKGSAGVPSHSDTKTSVCWSLSYSFCESAGCDKDE